MSNVLTSLIPDVYAALDVVSREVVGYIPAVTRDSTADRVALNQTLRSFVAPANTSITDYTPAMAFPTAAYQTIGNQPLTITRTKQVSFSWQGEEQYSLNAGGPGALTVRQNQILQCFRALVNQVELDLATLAVQSASRAVGTAGTTPFATTVSGTALAGQVLTDNGAPQSDRQFVINTTSGANLRTLMQLTRVNEGGTPATLRDGTLLNLNNFAIKESGQIIATVSGTASGAATDTAGYAIGATAITLQATGTGTIKKGDVITFTGDTNKYIAAAAVAAVSGGALVLQAPGLLKAIAASNVSLTVGAAYTPNTAFTRNAMCLATRLPAVPEGGDLANSTGGHQVATDPVSGLSFDYAVFPGVLMNTFVMGLNWGYFAPKPEHICTLLG